MPFIDTATWPHGGHWAIEFKTHTLGFIDVARVTATDGVHSLHQGEPELSELPH